MKNKVCIISCYFGILPEWFGLWLKSAEKNENFDFFLFTDDEDNMIDAPNIKKINMNIKKFNELCTKKVGINVNIEKPYKLCDFKPAYGKIFEDYIKEYDFWACCDIDMIFGRLDNFFYDDIFNNYEKINWCGHLTFYKNNKKLNELFKMRGSAFSYKKVFKDAINNYAFDEESGIKRIARVNKINEIDLNCFLDVDRRYKEFLAGNQKNFDLQIFAYKKNKILQIFIKDGQIQEKEYAYLHFQTKKPRVTFEIQKNLEDFEFFVNSNGFQKLENVELEKISENLEQLNQERNIFKRKQIEKFVKMSLNKKIIRIKQGIYKNI